MRQPLRVIRYTVATLTTLLLATSAWGATITLDADTAATGQNLDTTPLITTLGTISFTGEISPVSDPEFIAAGAEGFAFDILNSTSTATMSFDFDVASISFIYGGNVGVFDIRAYDAGNNLVDSFYQEDTYTGFPAGPVSLNGVGIRSITWTDPGFSFAPIDNVLINTVPIPAAVWLFGSALGGLGWIRRKQSAAN